MVGHGMGEDTLGGDTSSSPGAKPPYESMPGVVGPAEHPQVMEMLVQMWPPQWLVLTMCPRGVFSCLFLFHGTGGPGESMNGFF